ncbi:MAG: DUF4366 domain-containing protein [Defluviitaleaceae bacterium]|nr:DUF4366 domain-containing protein [Defluviitaleaceae bacterium]
MKNKRNNLLSKAFIQKFLVVALMTFIFTQSMAMNVYANGQLPTNGNHPPITNTQPQPQNGTNQNITPQNGRNIISITPLAEFAQLDNELDDFDGFEDIYEPFPDFDYQSPVDAPPDWLIELFNLDWWDEGDFSEPPPILRELLETNGQVILPPPTALTPAGGGELVDNIQVGDMEFITINSQAGNVFFLIIDRTREEDNVYFLAPVTEHYLFSLANQAGEDASIQQGALPGMIQSGFGIEPQTTAPTEDLSQSQRRAGISPLVLLAILGIAGAVGFVIFRLRAKKRNQGLDYYIDDTAEYIDDPYPQDEFEPSPPTVSPKESISKLQPLESADGAFEGDEEVTLYDVIVEGDIVEEDVLEVDEAFESDSEGRGGA